MLLKSLMQPQKIVRHITKTITRSIFNTALVKTTLVSAALAVGPISYAATIIPDAPQINAKGYILIDFTTGKVISETNADMQLAPASLTKMMTKY